MGLFAGLSAWLIQGMAFYYLLNTLGFSIGFPTAMAIYAIGILGGALSMIPGGIGTTEASMALLLISIDAPEEIALTAPLIIRIGTLWFAVTLGFLSGILLAVFKETGSSLIQSASLPDQNEAVKRR